MLFRSAPLPGVEWAVSKAGDAKSLARACEGCDAVMYLAGIIAEVGAQTYDRVHREGVANLLEAARMTGIGRWVQMSALGTRPDAHSAYHRSKWAGEAAVRASGLSWTIHRPSLIHGDGDGFLGFFERLSRWSPVLPLMGRPDALFQPVWVGDVAEAFARTLEKVVSVGRTYDLCGPDRWTMRGMLELLLRTTGSKRWLLRVPWPVAWCQAWAAEQVFARFLGRTPPLCRDQVRMLDEDNVGDPGPATRDLGIHFSGMEEHLRGRWPRRVETFFNS